MNKNWKIILLNLFLLVTSLFVLLQELYLSGTVEWYNENELADGDELFFFSICLIILIFSLNSIVRQLSKDKKSRIFSNLIFGLDIIYSFLGICVSIIFILLIIGNIENIIVAPMVFPILFIFGLGGVSCLILNDLVFHSRQS